MDTLLETRWKSVIFCAHQRIICIHRRAFIGIDAVCTVQAVGEPDTLGRLEENNVGNLVPAVRVVEQIGHTGSVQRVIVNLELAELSE